MDTIRTKRHKQLVEFLIAERKKAGIKQVELAKHLGKSQTWVARMENGGRRVDVIEFMELAELIGFNAPKVIRQLQKIEPELFKRRPNR